MPYKQNSIWDNGVVLSFDLVVSDLRQYYSKSSPQNAYTVIKQYLVNNGFTHIKDSDYYHTKLDVVDTQKLLIDFEKKHKWFPFCVGKVIISPNVKSLDVTQSIKKGQDKNWLAQRQAQNKKKHRDDIVR